jgi:lipoyl(octanoyl) transferase
MIQLSKDLINYPDALDVMNDHVIRRDEFIWVLRHPPVFTKGVKSEHIPPHLPYPYYIVNRGGKWTFHDPGQLIIYYVLDLKKRDWSFTDFLNHIQQFMKFFLKSLSIECLKGPEPGFWATCHGQLKKIGSVGVQIKGGMTLHGTSLNYTIDKKALSYIEPCGLDSTLMSSLYELGYRGSMNEIMESTCHTLNFYGV